MKLDDYLPTYRVPLMHNGVIAGFLEAQQLHPHPSGKGKKDLLERLIADDRMWKSPAVTNYLALRLKGDFRDGLQMQATYLAGVTPVPSVVFPRYIVTHRSITAHCCFAASVLDTTKPVMIGEAHYKDERGYHYYSLCECIELRDAETICALLNGTKPQEEA